MNEKLRNLLTGIASVLELYPRTDYSRFIPSESPLEMMRKDWELTGESISEALSITEDERQTCEQSSSRNRGEYRFSP